MTPSDQKIATLLRNLVDDQFDEVTDWDTCYQLVAQVISRGNFPASQYAPDSRYGGTEWTDDDYFAIAGEWCAEMFNHGARKLLGHGLTDRHVANAAKQSIYQFVVDRVKGSPRRDLWDSLKEALKDFETLTYGEPIYERQIPESSFPWQKEERSNRQRCYSAHEVRDALAVVGSLYPTGWTKLSLFNFLVQWSDAGDGNDTSLDIETEDGGSASKNLVDDRSGSKVDSFALGRLDAAGLLAQYSDAECKLLREYVIPNKMGLVVLKDAAKELGIAQSTLSDRAKRLWEQLKAAEFEETAARDSQWKRGFFSEILGESFGIRLDEPSTDSLESDQ